MQCWDENIVCGALEFEAIATIRTIEPKLNEWNTSTSVKQVSKCPVSVSVA
jgi:hypothetical protein